MAGRALDCRCWALVYVKREEDAVAGIERWGVSHDVFSSSLYNLEFSNW